MACRPTWHGCCRLALPVAVVTCTPTLDQAKQNPSMEEIDDSRPHPWWRHYWKLIVAEGEPLLRIWSLVGCSCRCPTPTNIWASLTGLSRLSQKKKKKKTDVKLKGSIRGNMEVVWKGSQWVHTIIFHCMHLWTLKTNKEIKL